jgi:hypothetical protein
MELGKYADLGFEITKFGAQSSALRFDQKPIFIFEANSPIDVEFLTHICDTYLKISEKRRDLSCIGAG